MRGRAVCCWRTGGTWPLVRIPGGYANRRRPSRHWLPSGLRRCRPAPRCGSKANRSRLPNYCGLSRGAVSNLSSGCRGDVGLEEPTGRRGESSCSMKPAPPRQKRRRVSARSSSVFISENPGQGRRGGWWAGRTANARVCWSAGHSPSPSSVVAWRTFELRMQCSGAPNSHILHARRHHYMHAASSYLHTLPHKRRTDDEL